MAGAMEDFAIDEMPEAALDIVRRDGEPSQGVMNEGAWEDDGGGFPGNAPKHTTSRIVCVCDRRVSMYMS